MKYKTIYADPPWMERGGGKIQRGADRHYPLMKTRDIMALPVRDLIHPEGCHLYLWTTNNVLPDALKVLEAWGFEYVTLITWMKDRQGLGQYYRGMTEHCIFARTKKKLPYRLEDGKRQQGVTGFYEAKRQHSEKPETMRQMIERVSYAPRIELFARDQHPGWDVWGNEVDGISFGGGIAILIKPQALADWGGNGRPSFFVRPALCPSESAGFGRRLLIASPLASFHSALFARANNLPAEMGFFQRAGRLSCHIMAR